MNTREVILKAREKGKCVPAFNVPHIPMVKPIIEAIRDENSVAMIQVARVEWEKMKAESLERIAEEYDRYKDPAHTLLHLDHVPVIDEDYQRVDYRSLIERAIRAGYQSVMIDGSRLPLEENISATREAADLAHAAQIPCEAELGAVMGHENKVMPPYEEIFASKMGFTRLDEAKRFAEESKCDWLSVAVGNIHGAVAEAVRNQKKPEAKIDVAHVAELYRAVGIPLVLHGGSGIQHQYILDAISAGIAKINVGTELRQTYEFALQESGNDVSFAQDALYKRTRAYIAEYLFNTNLKDFLFGRAYAGVGVDGTDVSGMYYNAATMTLHPGTQVQFGAVGVGLNLEYVDHKTGEKNNGRAKEEVIPHGFISHQINDSTWVGLAITVPYGLATDYGDN